MVLLVANLLFALLWYGSVSLFGWWIIGAIRSGDAGASGTSLNRKDNPIRFWFRVTWLLVWWIVFAALPLFVILKTGNLIQ
jgi:hypothetical protein